MTGIPFRNAETAWFWCVRMQQERWAGYRPDGSGSGRPCDIDDVWLALKRLHRTGAIPVRTIRTLIHYGLKQVPPDRRVDPMGLQAWDQGLDRLYTVLVEKGVVEMRQSHH